MQNVKEFVIPRPQAEESLAHASPHIRVRSFASLRMTLALLVSFLIFNFAFLIAPTAQAASHPPQEVTEQGIQDRFRKFFGHAASPLPGAELTNTFTVGEWVGFILNAMLLLVGMIFLIITVYSGITWMMAGGNEETIEKSRTRIKRATIGLIIVVGAWIITNFVLRAAFGPTRTPGGGAVQFRIF